MAKVGYKVGIFDGDIIVPSIPKSFGMDQVNQIVSDERLMIRIESNQTQR